MCGEGSPRDISPKEKQLEILMAMTQQENLTMADLKALCVPGVLSGMVARLHEESAHEKS